MEENVMITVIYEASGMNKFEPKALRDALIERGYEIRFSIPELTIGFEITGGYYSYTRGDKDSRGNIPSVFLPRGVIELVKPLIYEKDSCYVVLAPCYEKKLVLRIIGSKGKVKDVVSNFLMESSFLSMATIDDLRTALKWWDDDTEAREIDPLKEPREVNFQIDERWAINRMARRF